MDFEQLLRIAKLVLDNQQTLVTNFNAIRGSLGSSQIDQLNEKLSDIHNRNMELSTSIEEAAEEAKKKG